MIILSKLKVKIELIDETIEIPQVAQNGDACMDIRSNEEIELHPVQVQLIKTGIKLAIPEGYEGLIRPRSGLALRHGITVYNSPGTIDSSYRGEVGVILFNCSSTPFEIDIGDRIAQLAIRKVEKVRFEIARLNDTERSSGGFGSTGLR
ncbi:MAG: dUTP diphosphatase [Candidatus Kariarchaeaceae archaeon]